ncbi:hypothetical protein [Brevibacillus porteri]|uniref:hypothetical protein n=1 Tax=Brevibacillus porteri TaxID=2126350 RepID=UPI00370BFFCB
MELNNLIKEKVDKLIKFRLNQGVTPVELMSNIYNEDYIEVKAKRHFDQFFCNVSFYDCDFFTDKKVRVEYKYTYDNNFYLQKIVSVKNRNEQIIWSRSEEETKLLNDIIDAFSRVDNKETVNFFIKNLPDDLQELLQNHSIMVS